MSFIQNLFSSRDNNANSATYVGQQDRLWYDPVTNALYVSDGNTAGGVPVGFAGTGNGVPGGPTNSIQYNAGGGSFGGVTALKITPSNGNLSATGNIIAGHFYGDGGYLGNIQGSNIVGNIGNVVITGTANLGNLTISDQTIAGTVSDRDITLDPAGEGNVSVFANLVVSADAVDLPFNTTTISGLLPTAHFGGRDGQPSSIYNDSYSTSTPGGSPTYTSRRFNGTKASPVAVTSGQIIGTFIARGYDGTSFQTDAFSGMTVTAAENFSPVHQGTVVEIRTIPAGTAANTVVASFSNDTTRIGDFIFFDDSITIGNTAANLTIGTLGGIGNTQILSPFQVISNISNQATFEVDTYGVTSIYTPLLAVGGVALDLVATADGTTYPTTAPLGGYSLRMTGVANTSTSLLSDTFSNSATNTNSFSARRFRGNVTNPAAVQAGDSIMSLNTNGYNGANTRTGVASARISFIAAENFTTAQQSANVLVRMLRKGTLTEMTSATFEDDGIHIPDSLSGITFQDGTFQNTAYSTSNVVGTATAATGISIAPTNTSATGNITITNTGVITVAGTSNQVFVNGANNIAAANGAITLSLPQDIAPSSSPTFNNLTVGNLSIIGNVSNVIPSVVSGKIVYVANTATQWSDINASGLATGNIANGFYASMLYQTTSNTWDFTAGNSLGITAGNVYANFGQFDSLVQVGAANATSIYGNAGIQLDTNVDAFSQIIQQNHYQGANASSDFVAAANNGTDVANYIDMGINSNVYNEADYAVTGPNDGYLYVNGGNLIIGTQTPTNIIRFFTGGTNSATAYNRATITDAGLSVAGNISSNNIVANSYTGTLFSVTGNITGGNLLTGGILSTTGNIVGQNVQGGVVSATGNVIAGNVRTAGQVTATGNVTGGNVNTAGNVNAGNISASGNIYGGQLLTGGNLSASGNITGTYVVATVATNTVNLNATGAVSATGNVTGAYILGNGSQLSGLNAYGNVYANGTAVLAGNGSAALTMTPGNNQVITGNNTSKTVTIAVTDNPTFANVSVTGNITINGNVNYSNTSVNNLANIIWSNTAPLGTATPGLMEYDGHDLYFTPQDAERGIVPSQQWFVLNADRGLTYGSTTPQSLFGVGAHVSNGTRYWFRIKATVSRAAGTNNTALTLGWRGSATMSKISYTVQSSIGTAALAKASYMYETTLVALFTDQLTVTGTDNPPDSTNFIITGIIDVGASGAGTVEPYISWTGATAPGSVTVSSLSNFQIYPLGLTGSNTQVGNWS